MTFKVNNKARLLIGAAINHLKLAATAENATEFNGDVRAAVRALENASDIANPEKPLLRAGPRDLVPTQENRDFVEFLNSEDGPGVPTTAIEPEKPTGKK